MLESAEGVIKDGAVDYGHCTHSATKLPPRRMSPVSNEDGSRRATADQISVTGLEHYNFQMMSNCSRYFGIAKF